MVARRGAPKLALTVPTLTIPATTVKSSHPRTPTSPSTSSPTGRNTRLNQRGLSTMQPPTFSYSQSSNTKSILKKDRSSRSMSGKKLSFSEEPVVRSIEKLPQECYGEYVKMSKDERRWGRGH